jgi:rSAM/selenodomain-associated transferase 1
MVDHRVILFYRTPERGRVKTRIASVVGEDAALDLYRAMVADLLGNLEPMAGDILLYEAVAPAVSADRWAGLERFERRTQRGGDLGERIYNALAEVLEREAERALLIGTDIPQVDSELLGEYLDLLDTVDAVVGPSSDGGYYLFGCGPGGLSRRVFEGVEWSSGSVLAQTLERVQECGLSIGIGRTMRDIDRWEDLEALSLDSLFRDRARRVVHEFERIKTSR